jgi:capsid protein
LKEVSAADEKVKCGFSTIEREAMELNGSDYRDNIRQSATEKEAFEEADLIYPPYRREVRGGGIDGGEPGDPSRPSIPGPRRGPGQPADREEEMVNTP